MAQQTVRKTLPNCLICMGGEETEEISRVVQIKPFALECNIDYFAEVMEELRGLLPDFIDYTFVFTRSVTELPTKFDHLPNVVVHAGKLSRADSAT